MIEKFIIATYFLMSGIVPGGESGIASRIGYSDILMIFLILITFVKIAIKKRMYMDRIHKSFFFYICFMVCSSLFSVDIKDSVVETIAYFFLFLSYFSLCNAFYKYNLEDLHSVAKYWSIGAGIIAIYSLYSFIFLGITGELENALVGTFRNTGQAGYFFFCGLSISIPMAIYSEKWDKKIHAVTSFILMIALILTLKRSAILGFFVGFSLVAINHLIFGSAREKIKMVSVLSVFSLVAVNVILIFLEKFEPLLNKFTNKSDGGVASKFINENLAVSWAAFSDNPIMGAGPGGIIGHYSKVYEIHSTYLASLATLGLIGIILYMIFFCSIFNVFFNIKPKYCLKKIMLVRDFGLMFLGQAVCWGYTTHFRKREFWISLSIATAITYFFQKNTIKKNLLHKSGLEKNV